MQVERFEVMKVERLTRLKGGSAVFPFFIALFLHSAVLALLLLPGGGGEGGGAGGGGGSVFMVSIEAGAGGSEAAAEESPSAEPLVLVSAGGVKVETAARPAQQPPVPPALRREKSLRPVSAAGAGGAARGSGSLAGSGSGAGAGDGRGDGTGGRGGAAFVPIEVERLAHPKYPFSARLRGQEGRVVYEVRVSEAGVLEDVALLQSSLSDELDRAAREALLKAVFHPARKNGAPIASSKKIAFRFALEDGE